MPEQERARGDAHECAFFAGILGLESGKSADQGEGFGVGFEDGVDALDAAGDDEDVVVLEVGVRVFVIDVGFDGEAGG